MTTKLAIGARECTLARVLGAGATSLVLLAEAAGERFVVKVGRDAGERRRFADEAQRLCLVDSPWVAPLLDVLLLETPLSFQNLQIERGAPLLVFAWQPGESLARHARSGEEARRLASIVARDIGAALADLHGVGAAHGDVKPENIVFDGEHARLIDFGLAGDAGAETVTGGTRRYLAPEVLSGETMSDGRRRDLFALGVVLHELLGSAQPTPSSDVPPVGRDPLEEIAQALTARAPAARPLASWVAGRAAALFGGSDRRLDPDRARAVARAYRYARQRELALAAGAEQVLFEVGPRAKECLSPALTLLRKVRELRGTGARGTRCLRDLDAMGRARFCVALVGAAASAWPALALGSDDELLGAALRGVSKRAPGALTLRDFEALGDVAEEPATAETDELTLLLAIRDPAAPESLLSAVEERVLNGGAKLLRRELVRILRLRGELGRALALLEPAEDADTRIELAELLKRAGESARALEIARELQVSSAAPAIRSRAAALRARNELDRGELRAAAELLKDAAETPQLAECRALLELARARGEAARREATRAKLLARSDEQRARAEAVAGMIAHAAGQPQAALAAFRASAEFAARAGAVLEEATYATGVAAAAADLGDLGQALAAAGRALLLFEHLGRGAEAARALLAMAASSAAAGARLEARDFADAASARARQSGDKRCRAYAHLLLCDVAESSGDALEHARRARSLLEPYADDDLRCAARLHEHGAQVDLAACDAQARTAGVAIDARLEWWTARARVLRRSSGHERSDGVLTELLALSRVVGPVPLRGAALFAGAQLAAHSGDGDTARHLAEGAAEAARELMARVPDALRPSALALPWVAAAGAARDSEFSPRQLHDLSSLVRALSHRDGLRPLLDQVLDALVLWTGVERGLLLLRAPNGKLRPRAARNLRREDLRGTQLELSTSLAERALSEGRPVVAVDAAGDLPEVHESVHALKLRSVLSVPLVARGEPLGVVYLDDRIRRGAFGARELGFVELVATLAAVAIADARDQLLLRRSARRAERAKLLLDRELAQREAELAQAERELSRARSGRDTRFAYPEIIGESEALRSMLRVVDRVTAAEVPVLLVGESGSGKELVARAIHENGPRAKANFVSENCAAIPEALLESTLFGHVKGAFTGAQRSRAGLFEVADGGTLFLDEIGEMSLGMQTKLLRALQSGEVRPVGAESLRHVDVRVIGATHRDLAALVGAGKFREDLLYRLNVISVRVPPLRERIGDIPILVRYFITRHAGGKRIGMDRAALDALALFAWPGNVRQLENEVRRALVLADDQIRLEHLSREVVSAARGPGKPEDEFDLRGRVDALEADLVRAALRRTQGNQTRAAELLGLSRFGLQKMMKRLEIRQGGEVS
jgi:transcriptional regulator with GAF, ATPase, and Fis domain/serine/threonine protein kinase